MRKPSVEWIHETSKKQKHSENKKQKPRTTGKTCTQKIKAFLTKVQLLEN